MPNDEDGWEGRSLSAIFHPLAAPRRHSPNWVRLALPLTFPSYR